MIDDIEILEKLQAPQREITAYVQQRGSAAEDAYTSATSVCSTTISPERHLITVQYELNNLLEINDYTVTGETTVYLENPIAAGEYYLSGVFNNSNTSTYKYVTIGFIYENGASATFNFTPHSTLRRRSSINLSRTAVAVIFGNANYPSLEFTYKELMVSKYNASQNYTPYTPIDSSTSFQKAGYNLFPQRTVITDTQYAMAEVRLDCILNPGSLNIRIGSITGTDEGITQCYLKFVHLGGGGSYDLFSVSVQDGVQYLNVKLTKACNKVILGNESAQMASFTFTDVSFSYLSLYDYYDYVRPTIVVGNDNRTFGTYSVSGSEGFTIWGIENTNIYFTKVSFQRINRYAILNEFYHYGDLISFQVDSMGENKFFGYGITKKLTLKVRDIERRYEFNKEQYLEYILDDYIYSIPFDIYEVTRDENTNEITVIAYDRTYKFREHTAKELDISAPYTIDSLLYSIFSTTGGISDYWVNDDALWENIFCQELETGINIDGTETLKELMDDIAEYTGCIYYDYDGDLIFVCMNKHQQPVFTINKEDYFTLETKGQRRVGTIATVTDLGDNVSYKYADGETVYLYNNCIFDNSADIVAELEGREYYLGGFSMEEFTLDWRGNYLLELGDCIEIETKDSSYILAYLVNDTLIYNGGLRQISKWQLDNNTSANTNPATIGEAIKETYAKVDKQSKRIDLVVSEVAANTQNIASLQLTTSGISATVAEYNKATTEALQDVANDVTELTNKVNLTMSAEDIKIEVQKELANGASKVETSTGFTFDEVGLTISKSSSDIETTITEDGMTISRNGAEVLTANNEGVKAIDLHATTFLIIGNNSRLEDYGSRTACFWIGGSN